MMRRRAVLALASVMLALSGAAAWTAETAAACVCATLFLSALILARFL